MALKDQSGSSAAGDWLEFQGQARHRSNRHRVVTKPITRERFREVTDAELCMGCGGDLRYAENPRGGCYWQCKARGADCFYIGWRAATNTGEEKIIY